MPGDSWKKRLGGDPFWRLVDKTGSCWEWLGKKDVGGYGQTGVKNALTGHRTTQMAHRRTYEALIGPVSAGMVLDHTCKNRGCVNPAHLEVVTQRENLMRSPTFQAINAAKTECVNGHPFDEANTYWWTRPNGTVKRTCRACAAERTRAHKMRRSPAANAA